MKSVGIVSEYNPFHNGHKYQIEKAKEISGAECVIAVMSGNFVQRGDVSLYSKYDRAKIAVENGVDLVIELPAYFSLQSAEGFSEGAIKILDALRCDAVSFGCETDDINLLTKTATLLKEEGADFKKILRSNLKKGNSFAASRQEAFSTSFPEGAAVIMKPNNILATEYISAAKKINSDMTFFPVKRIGAEHDSSETENTFSSASHIRTLIKNKKSAENFVPSLPDNTPVFTEDFEKYILYAVISATDNILQSISGGNDGMWQRILSFNGTTYEELLLHIKTKRFALSRIKRYVMNLFIGNTLSSKLSPTYLRPLALNSKGAAYLKENISSFKLPVYTKPSKIPSDDAIFSLERRASRIRSLVDNKVRDDIYMSPLFIK